MVRYLNRGEYRHESSANEADDDKYASNECNERNQYMIELEVINEYERNDASAY